MTSVPLDVFHLSGDVYTVHPDTESAATTEQERAAVVTRFRCSLFNDLEISLEDIFYRIF